MPLTINVGLCRKASFNYNSAGTSINLTAELDPSLLGRPRELQAEIDRLYAQAEAALDRQARESRDAEAKPPATNGDGSHVTNGRHRTEPPATTSQQRAIATIAREAGVDAEAEARDLLGSELSGLTRPQASYLIHHLQQRKQIRCGE